MIANNKFLTEEELSMLLRSADNAEHDSLAGICTTDKDTDLNNKTAEAIRQMMLSDYCVDICPSIRDFYLSFPSKSLTFFNLECNDEKGFIAISDSAITGIVGQILGDKNAEKANQKPTPAVLAFLPEIITNIARAIASVVTPNHQWLCCPSDKEDFNPNDADIRIQFFANAFILVKYPLPSLPKRSVNTQNLPLEINAVIAEKKVSLREIINLNVGSFLPLGVKKDHPVSLTCGQQTIFKGNIGQQFKKIAVKITEKV